MSFRLPNDRPALMAILNVTPDSFSDGGQFRTPEEAIGRGLALMAEGADLVDVGGESTRPGSQSVALEVELERVLPVVEGLVRAGVPVSIDTSKPDVARAALAAGVQVLNDVTGFRQEAMREVALEFRPAVVAMHMQGIPATMQAAPAYDDVVEEVTSELVQTAHELTASGLEPSQVWLDPGIGFGKSYEHNLLLLRHLSRLVSHGFPVLVGVSRKTFLGRILGGDHPAPVADRFEASLAAQLWCQAAGARIIRCHDVRPARRVIDTWAALAGAP